MKKVIALLISLIVICSCIGLAEQNFEMQGNTLTAYIGKESCVKVPDNVERIANGAFLNNETITELILPKSLNAISNNAIASCPNLKSVVLPEGIVAIGMHNFEDCAALESVTVPASVEFIGRGCFSWCANLKEVRFEGKLPQINLMNSFAGNNEDFTIYAPDDELENYTKVLSQIVKYVFGSGKKAIAYEYKLPESDFEIDEYGALRAYKGSSAYVPIPESIGGKSVVAIGSNAFRDENGKSNDDLLCVDIPEGVTAIEDDAFAEFHKLEKVTLPSTLKTIGERAFRLFGGELNTLPDSLDYVGSEAFYFVSLGNELEIPKSLKNIGDNAFKHVTELHSLYFPEHMESIGEGAFAETNVEYINFASDYVPPFPQSAFNGETLEDVDIAWNATREQFNKAKDAFAFAKNCTVWRNNPGDAGIAEYPENVTGNSITVKDGIWTKYPGSIADLTSYSSYDNVNITGIGDRIFKGNKTIRSFYPHHCDFFYTIGKEAFMNSSVEYVEIFDSIKDIGERAFANCKNMTELTLPSSLESIGKGAFKGCSGIKSLTINCDISLLPDGALKDVKSLERVSIASGDIPAKMFKGLPISVLELGKDVRSIGAEAFANTNIEELIFDNPCDIGAQAFKGIPASKIILPADGEIDASAFDEVSKDVIRANVASSDERLAALGEKLGFPWYEGLLREGEESKLIAMPFEPTDPKYFEFDAKNGTLLKYTGKDVDVVIPREIDGVVVKSLSYDLFDECRDYTDTELSNNRESWVPLRSVVLPETIESMEDSVFNFCQQLETFVCYAPLETTGKGTFELCRSLNNVIFVNGVKNIDNYCFKACGNLENLYLGKHIESIGIEAFSLSNAKKLVLDAKNIANNAVRDMQELKEIHFTSKLEAAEVGAVVNCPKLSLVCIEGKDMSFVPNDGIIYDPAPKVTIQIPESFEDADSAGRIVTGSLSIPDIVVKKAVCERVEQELPDIAGLIGK